MSTENKASEIGNRIKALERLSEGELLPPDKPFIVRLDGHGFSKLTKKLNKPFDIGFAQAMIATAGELLTEFSACCAFTASDEITLVFPPISNPESTLIYKGRKQKICSLTAGFASTHFNVAFESHLKPVGRFYFDARVFSVPDTRTAFEAVYWRYKYDTFRNGVSAVAQSAFSHKQLHKKSTGEMMRMLKEKGIMLNKYSGHLLYGTFAKKKLVEVEGTDPRTGETVMVTRGRVHFDQVKLGDMSEEEQTDFIMRKYW